MVEVFLTGLRPVLGLLGAFFLARLYCPQARAQGLCLLLIRSALCVIHFPPMALWAPVAEVSTYVGSTLKICCHNVSVRHNPTEADIREYFWSLVDKNGPLPDPATGVKSKCWLWLGSVTDQGYGRFRAGKKIYMATRYAWREKGRRDPGALTVSTRCRNKLCVRHLYTRTRAAIMASVPRRWASGEDSWLARTTSKQVLQLRKLYAKGDLTQAMLAERFGLSLSNVKSILARRSWKHL
jgi:hypothetical protein